MDGTKPSCLVGLLRSQAGKIIPEFFKPGFLGNRLKFSRYFKGGGKQEMSEFVSSQVGSPGFVQISRGVPERAANGGLSLIRCRSPPSHLAVLAS